jgi:thiamine kinase-like enzyme
MHAHFAGSVPDGLAPLPPLVATFAPSRLKPFVAMGHPIVAAALDGWGLFASLVPSDVAAAVEALLDEPTPLVTALSECTPTLCHGDLATVNLAWEDDGCLTLIDWGQAVAAPGEFDITRLVAGCAPVLGVGREAFLDEYRRAAQGSTARAMRLSLLAGLLWLGWNKALDASRHPDEAKRAREQEDLAWWVEKGREALDAGL